MSIGSRIRELRENKHITRNEFAEMIGVTVGAISNYENDVSSPKEPILFKIIETLECEPNYIFQDMVKIKTQNNDVTLAEYDYIKKYRSLDPYGQETISYILDREVKRVAELQKPEEHIKELKKEFVPTRILAYYGKIAAAGKSYGFEDITAGTVECPLTEKSQIADYTIGVSGNSMEPTYHDGDIVYVKKNVHLNIGDIGIFQKDNGIYIKEVGANGLISHNKGYKPLINGGTVICLGKVLGKIGE